MIDLVPTRLARVLFPGLLSLLPKHSRTFSMYDHSTIPAYYNENPVHQEQIIILAYSITLLLPDQGCKLRMAYLTVQILIRFPST